MNIGLCIGAILLGFIPDLSLISLVCEIVIMFTTAVGSTETMPEGLTDLQKAAFVLFSD